MSSVLIMAVAVSLSATWSSRQVRSGPVEFSSKMGTTRLVVGALAGLSTGSSPRTPVTFLSILEFSPAWSPQEPEPTEVRLCGDFGRELAILVHANVSVVYEAATNSKSIGCHSLVSIKVWQDDSRWQTIQAPGAPTPNYRYAPRGVFVFH
jgi:hypothetical protein